MAIRSIYERRSIRKFQNKAVPIELIGEVLNAGKMAPSAKNRQPWKFIVFGNEQKRELLEVMERGLEREEKGITDLPKSRYGIPDARNTLRVMQEAPIVIIVPESVKFMTPHVSSLLYLYIFHNFLLCSLFSPNW